MDLENPLQIKLLEKVLQKHKNKSKIKSFERI